ncbi:MAG: glycoside hydrolase family 2 protein, partial [Pseudomonadota bacterium]
FCSEFGFQSYPSMNAIRRFAAPADKNIAAPVLESHQKNAGGNARIAETMFRYFRWPETFQNFVYLSQIQQGLAIKTAVTHWRSLKPRCMGTLIWQLNDAWPVCSWASLDHGGDWKLMHYMARDFYAPLLVTAIPKNGQIILRAVNDDPQPVELNVTVCTMKLDGTLGDLGTVTATVSDEAVDLMKIPNTALAPDEMLHFHWTDTTGLSGSDTYAPRPFKSYNLQAPDLISNVNGNEITVSARSLALFVALEADVPGRFDANAFTLLAGERKTVRFMPTNPDDQPTFVRRDLYSATHN